MPLVLTRRLQPLHGIIDLVPVVTVVLLLLLFFLLSSSFVLQPGIKVEPPKMAIWQGTPSSRLVVAVAMSPPQYDASGVAVTPHPVMYFNDQIVTLDGLGRQLDQLPVGRDTRTLVLKADKDVPLNVVTDIMNTAFEHHLYSVQLAAQPVSP
jgi:biopolymer transport protein ExbD